MRPAAVAASDKRAERAALNDIVDLVPTAVQRLASGHTTPDALFDRIVDAWSSEPLDIRSRGIAFDVALIHIASMSNLMAALGWAFVELGRGDDGVREGEAETLGRADGGDEA